MYTAAPCIIFAVQRDCMSNTNTVVVHTCDMSILYTFMYVHMYYLHVTPRPSMESLMTNSEELWKGKI